MRFYRAKQMLVVSAVVLYASLLLATQAIMTAVMIEMYLNVIDRQEQVKTD